MSTVSEQLAQHNYPNQSVFLSDMYLYLLFVYVGGAALISGMIILIVFKLSKHDKIKNIKK